MLFLGHTTAFFQNLKSHQKSLYAACLMLFFWTLFDGTVSYVTPLKISQAGFSDTMLGLIIGFSSVAGGTFDFLLSKFLTNTHFRRVYLLLFAVCFAYPLILWEAKGIWLFLIAMALWGLYYDLDNFATYDFVGRKFDSEEHSGTFGIIYIFKELGYMIAPLIAGFALGAATLVDYKPFLLMFVFLTISFSFYFLLKFITSKATREYIEQVTYKPLNFPREFSLWKKVGRILLPPLIIIMLYNVYDSFFWTLGPLLAESFTALHPFNGLFLTMYTLPFLVTGFLVGQVTKKMGKKRTAFLGFLLGSLTLSLFFFLRSPLLILGDIFIASFFVGFTIPAINGAFADYISESSGVEKEIEAVTDFFTNVGYVVGPILAGFLADTVGTSATFSVLGVIGAVVATVLLVATPKKITVNVTS